MLRRMIGGWALLAATSALVLAAEPRVLNLDISAEGLAELELDTREGKVVVTGSDTDRITAELKLVEDKKWLVVSSKKAREAIAGATLASETRGERVVLSVDWPIRLSDDDEDYIGEEWTISLPEAFAVNLELGVGEAVIENVAGGVEADIGVGALKINVPLGDLEAEVGVGEIDVTTATPSYGDIRLNASVGDVSLNLRGHRVKPNRPPGPSADITLEGDGDDDIQLDAGVGDVSLVVTGE